MVYTYHEIILKKKKQKEIAINMHCCCCCCVASVMSDSVQPHRRQPSRLPRPWDSLGKNTGVGCHFLLQYMIKREISRYSMLSHSVMSDFLKYHGLQPTRLLCPWGFSRQEYWSGLPCPPPGVLPNPGIKYRSAALQVDSLLSEPPVKQVLCAS